MLDRLNTWLDEPPKSAAEKIVQYKAEQEAKGKTPTFEGYLKTQGPLGRLTVLLKNDEVKNVDG